MDTTPAGNPAPGLGLHGVDEELSQPLLTRREASKLPFTDISESSQRFSGDLLLIFKDSERAKREAPPFKLQQRNRSISCLVVIGQCEDMQRALHSVDVAVDRVDPAWIVFQMMPIECAPLLGNRLGHERSEVFHER